MTFFPAMPPIKTYTSPLDPEQAELLREILDRDGFTFETRPHMLYFAKKGKLSVSVYRKGPKVVVQGKETGDFIRFTLEPRILGEAKLGYEEIHHPERYQPHFGIDESGKGDFFGPLAVSGVYVDGGIARSLVDGGVADSKRIGSDARIRALAEVVRKTPGVLHETILIGPAKYNELYRRIGNLNRLLAWGHARVIENLASRNPGCPRALSDKFGNPALIERALMKAGRRIQLDQMTKAESDPAVAAASILAREAFINWMDKASRQHGVDLPKGASRKVQETGRALVAENGVDILESVAKTHFRTAWEIAPAHFPKPAPRDPHAFRKA